MASFTFAQSPLLLAVALLMPVLLTEGVSYGGSIPPADSIQSRIIPPFSPSLELARSMGSSPVTPQGADRNPLRASSSSSSPSGYDTYLEEQRRHLEEERRQQLDSPRGMEEGVARGVAIPDAAYPRDLISEKGPIWPKDDVPPLPELGLSDEDDEGEEEDEEDDEDEMDEEEMCPRVDDGFNTWRKNKVVRATLTHMVPSSCTPPMRCSVSTTVHRRVFLQDGDTLEVVLQAPPDYTPPTNPPTEYTPPTNPPTTHETVNTEAAAKTKGDHDEEGAMYESSPFPTQQPRPSHPQGNTEDTKILSETQRVAGTEAQARKPQTQPQQSSPSRVEEDGVHPTEFLQLQGQQEQQKSQQQKQYQKPESPPPPATEMPQPLVKTQELPKPTNPEERKQESGFSQKDQMMVSPTANTPALQISSSSTPAKGSVVKEIQYEGVKVSSSAHVSGNKTHLFSRDDHHIIPSHPTFTPTSSSDARIKREAPQHFPQFRTKPPAILDAVGDVTRRKKMTKERDDGTTGPRWGEKEETREEEKEENPVTTFPLTIWRVSVSEWSSCSTREGGQIGETTPEGIVTITPRFLQVGTNYFIGRSSWSSTECFQLQVTVRSAECGEGSLCSGKGSCYANATMEHFLCHCCKAYMGTHCEEMDACVSNPCLNYGMCVDIQEGHHGDTFQCLCRSGFRGRYCEERIDMCQSEPCHNGGTCTGNESDYTCRCPSRWAGKQCTEPVEVTVIMNRPHLEKDEMGCAANPCKNGICVETRNRDVRCFCHPGFGGERCEFEYNECDSSPCENGGTCEDKIGNFQCLCGRGYTGERCQIKYDLCSPDPCDATRVCVDKGNTYSCECINGLSEDDCGPHIQVCDPNPCDNGGTCWVVPQARVFYCSCRPGFTGTTCQGITLDNHDEAVPETVGAVGTVDPGPLEVQLPKVHLPMNHMRNIYVAFATLASALLIFVLVVGACHCRVNRTYRKCFVKIPRPSKVLPSVRRPRPTSLFDKSRWEKSGALRLEADPDGASMPMTSSNSDAVYYNMDVCDNQELPLIK